MKKGLFKQIDSLANGKDDYSHLKGWGRIRYNRKKARPLHFSPALCPLSERSDSRLMVTFGSVVEDNSLRVAKREMAKKAVPLYNKGPYGLLTESLAEEMANGENRRRS